MRFYSELFMSDDLADEKRAVIDNLKKGIAPLKTFIIILPHVAQNNLEIVNIVFLRGKIKRGEDFFVVGIASGYADALKIVENITQTVYDNTGGADIRRYITEKQNERDTVG